MRTIKCKHCPEEVTLVSGPTSDIDLNEFLGAGVWMYLHIKQRHPEIYNKFPEEKVELSEDFIKEVKKLYCKVFFDI